MIGIVFQTALVEAADQARIVNAISQQVDLHFAPAWNRLPSHPRLFSSMATVPEGLPVIRVVDVVDDPDALGYHTEERDRVTGIVGAKTILDAGGSILKGADSVSACLSHEVLEASINPFVGGWEDGPAAGEEFAREVCDPCQDQSYAINGIAVSDFVLPAWFDAQNRTGPYDHLGVLRKPFTRTRGGYIVLRDASRTTRQLGERPVWKRGGPRAAKLMATP
jgi:hypothetical protein